MLIEPIANIVGAAADQNEAALLVTLYLEYHANLDIEGNGWLDDEPAWEALDEEAHTHLLRKLDALFGTEYA
ncbi:hypothetical protein S7335_1215 [Synechococcus sp. PCC 7335]|uniref:hypothetical protein n=1 Tax=Synechococcus sp. (strain ATCC 29403 / PCC 7335) TaxID=91464 RepID=UPI00017EE140|nr:hypothetical protein [Synechococcus sp. PCC 7335]EDX82511.1 hypothetical protein S7335_1215 [Synechococcus sp. PCC 7335]